MDGQDAGVASPESALLVGQGPPLGVPFDREDAPLLAREIDALCKSLSRSVPTRIVFTAEFAVREHELRTRLGLKRERTLGIGWPLLFVLDADELRAALALALGGAGVTLPPGLDASADAGVAALLGKPLLTRTLSRSWAAAALVRDCWLPSVLKDAGRRADPTNAGLSELRRLIERHGRAGWQGLLDELAQAQPFSPQLARLAALGGAVLDGGSHRNAAQALLWEGLVERMTTALESAFASLLQPHWQARRHACADVRERAQRLEQARRADTIDAAGLLELAAAAELLFGAHAAHTLYRAAFAQARSPMAALGLGRTLCASDPARARGILEKLSTTRHPVSADARALLVRLPMIASSPQRRQTSDTVLSA